MLFKLGRRIFNVLLCATLPHALNAQCPSFKDRVFLEARTVADGTAFVEAESKSFNCGGSSSKRIVVMMKEEHVDDYGNPG